MILRKKGFTLVEMLVVIAIIAILAAALFPAIQNAINTAKASAIKNKGRGVWIGIVSANAEREPLNLVTLWPGSAAPDLLLSAGSASTNNFTKSTAYFSALMKCDSSTALPAADTAMRFVTDLNPGLLGGLEWPAAANGSFPANGDGNMWNLLVISDSSASEDSFLISRNVDFGSATTIDATVSNATLVASGSNLSKTRGMFVTRGGGTFDLKALYLNSGKIVVSTNSYTLWKAP